MIKRFLRVSLTTLALLLAIAGSLNVNRVGANVEPVGGLCDYCGCNGGGVQCCSQGNIMCYRS